MSYGELVERLEKSGATDRNLDAEVWCAVHGKTFKNWNGVFCDYEDAKGHGWESWIPRYSGSRKNAEEAIALLQALEAKETA